MAADKAEQIASSMIMESRLQVWGRGGPHLQRAAACLPLRGQAPGCLARPRHARCWGALVTRRRALSSPHFLQSRAQAVIDQVSGLITFRVAAEPLAQWDCNIAGICQAVNSLIEEAAAKGIKLEA